MAFHGLASVYLAPNLWNRPTDRQSSLMHVTKVSQAEQERDKEGRDVFRRMQRLVRAMPLLVQHYGYLEKHHPRHVYFDTGKVKNNSALQRDQQFAHQLLALRYELLELDWEIDDMAAEVDKIAEDLRTEKLKPGEASETHRRDKEAQHGHALVIKEATSPSSSDGPPTMHRWEQRGPAICREQLKSAAREIKTIAALEAIIKAYEERLAFARNEKQQRKALKQIHLEELETTEKEKNFLLLSSNVDKTDYNAARLWYQTEYEQDGLLFYWLCAHGTLDKPDEIGIDSEATYSKEVQRQFQSYFKTAMLRWPMINAIRKRRTTHYHSLVKAGYIEEAEQFQDLNRWHTDFKTECGPKSSKHSSKQSAGLAASGKGKAPVRNLESLPHRDRTADN